MILGRLFNIFIKMMITIVLAPWQVLQGLYELTSTKYLILAVIRFLQGYVLTG